MVRVKLQIAGFIFSTALLASCGGERQIGRSAKPESVPSAGAVNINIAGVDDLRRIPSIGEKLAAEIVEFREKHGPVRRTEHLLLIKGISDRRFREIRHLVRVE